MSTIKVERAHSLGRDEALRRAQSLLQEYGDRFKAKVTWSDSGVAVAGSGFSGRAEVSEDRVSIALDLGLVLRPLKARIENRLARELDAQFA